MGSHIAGSFFEFGTHRARTLTMVMGLDAFYASNLGITACGLTPKPGGVKTSSDEFLELLTGYGQTTERVELIAGSLEKSLTKSLAEKFIAERVKASLITVD